MASLSIAAAVPAAAHSAGAAKAMQTSAKSVKWIKPHKVNELDCNAWGKKYKSVSPGFRKLCTDPRGALKGSNPWSTGSKGYNSRGRFQDNGHYVGHDEPSVKFISTSAKSGNTMTYFMKMPTDPARHATNNGKVVDYGELSAAPWFGLAICDPRSYPQNPCAPDSDSNTGLNHSTDAGSAFMELQFYPPRFAPFADSASCSATKWCAAMTIDSLEAGFNFVGLNTACEEPVNFAFLQTNGVPAGPPSPQLANGSTFVPNAHTLMINSGDVLKVAITDPAAGFTTTVTDVTTGQTGTITASAANGFMDTNFKTCAGTPHTFHAEYATAKPQNQVPWAALEGGVLMQQEIGHSEVCASLTHNDPINEPGIVVDNKISDTCVGGSEGGRHDKGEGGCNTHTGVCLNASTEGTTGPIACPSNNFASGQLCEYADGACLPQGTRTVTVNGHKVKETSPVNFCQDNRFQNGDLDFDGIDYQKTTWPNGSSNVPTSIRYAGPFDAAGHSYPSVQFQTDAPASEFLCNIFNGNNCDAPPLGAKFYPWWTLTSKSGQGVGGLFPSGSCIWNFGNRIAGVTTNNLGADAQYGVPDVARFGGTTISAVERNPEVTGNCAPLTEPHAQR
jgi:hypothetical protein